MPRCARIKDDYGIYHIYSRSSSDISLFRSQEDKEKFLSIVKKYKNIFRFKIYSYCLMNTHYHFIIDSNGSDLSKFIKSINQSYAQYYNRKYSRHGHVFSDRFKSILIHENNNRYLLVLSSYIHNNPKDIPGFRDKVEKYKYSSLGIYLGLMMDLYKIVDSKFILDQFSKNKFRARQLYLNFIYKSENHTLSKEVDIEFQYEKSEYISDKKLIIRRIQPEKIIDFISRRMDSNVNINVKFNHKNSEFRAICVLIMRSLCGLSHKEISNILGNVTSSNVGKLCNKGLDLINSNQYYSKIMDELILSNTAN